VLGENKTGGFTGSSCLCIFFSQQGISMDSGRGCCERLYCAYCDSFCWYLGRWLCRTWSSINSTSDGTHLVAAANGGYIYTSNDSGISWVNQTNATSKQWSTITSSSDGTQLAATINGGYIYTSNNSGVTCAPQPEAGSKTRTLITLSSNGTHLAATVGGGAIYTAK
jgi:hypothetical protein